MTLTALILFLSVQTHLLVWQNVSSGFITEPDEETAQFLVFQMLLCIPVEHKTTGNNESMSNFEYCLLNKFMKPKSTNITLLKRVIHS